MKSTDGFKLATSAAALLLASASLTSTATAAEPAEPVKISQCEGVAGAAQGINGTGIVTFASGHAMVSKSLCDKLGGSEVASVSAPAAAPVPEGVQVAYCDDLFSCNTFSACKGNGNDNCAGKNSCHSIGFVAIASGDLALSGELCSKLGGNLISEL